MATKKRSQPVLEPRCQVWAQTKQHVETGVQDTEMYMQAYIPVAPKAASPPLVLAASVAVHCGQFFSSVHHLASALEPVSKCLCVHILQFLGLTTASGLVCLSNWPGLGAVEQRQANSWSRASTFRASLCHFSLVGLRLMLAGLGESVGGCRS
ncbi:unnamed protein product [Protopolystoma xenopodis]|uniref:Uncharacterized protein n=1 Tax=Protopolystoma xenopodis TaxID=117903 RepID=A0A3S5CL66_9PLAT|nr:unnamed protein product [Protopolystoma xenopodis]